MENFQNFQKEIVADVFERLKKSLYSSNSEMRIYFTGTSDVPHSDFEERSNNLKIGVIANKSVVARNLLFFLRIIQAETGWAHRDLSSVLLDVSLENPRAKISDYISHFAALEQGSTVSFSLNEVPTVTLFHGPTHYQTISVPLCDIDIWTLPRIQEHIGYIIN